MKKAIWILIIILIIGGGFYLYQNNTVDVSTQTITASFCNNLYQKDSGSFYITSGNSQGKTLSTTTIDFKDVVSVTHYSSSAKIAAEHSGKEYVPEIIPIKNWTEKNLLSNSQPSGHGCNPGNVEITGAFNNASGFVAKSITDRAQ